MRLRVLGVLSAFVLTACGVDIDASRSSSQLTGAWDDWDDGESSVDSSESPEFAPELPGDELGPTEKTASEKLGAPYPVVLVHGMGGFGTLKFGLIKLTYFDGVVEELAKNGEAAYTTLTPPFASSDVRAEALAPQIDQILARTGKAKVNIIAHSQGGLDARILASPNGLGYGDRIASITTIATPHHGTKVADSVHSFMKLLPSSIVDEITGAVLSLLQKSAYELQSEPSLREQMIQLSEKYMKEVFNPRYIDDPNVSYVSYAGRSNLRSGEGECDGGVYPNQPSILDPVQVALLPTALYLEGGKKKVNDGLVTVESAKWGTFKQCVPADHLKEIGMFGAFAASFDHVAMYRDIVVRLRDAGF